MGLGPHWLFSNPGLPDLVGQLTLHDLPHVDLVYRLQLDLLLHLLLAVGVGSDRCGLLGIGFGDHLEPGMVESLLQTNALVRIRLKQLGYKVLSFCADLGPDTVSNVVFTTSSA